MESAPKYNGSLCMQQQCAAAVAAAAVTAEVAAEVSNIGLT